MKPFYKICYLLAWMSFFLFMPPCSHGQVTDTLSLNGLWKFNTFLGEGSNYLDIVPGPRDIIIDNEDSMLIEIKGPWKLRNKAERESSSWKDSYLQHYFQSADTPNVRFRSKVPQTGYYEHFIYYPWSHHMAARITVKHADGEYTKEFSQRNRTSRWLSLGIYKVEKDSEAYIEFASTYKGSLAADAIMLRSVPASAMEESRKKIARAFQPEYEDAEWHKLKVPGHWGMINKYSNYTGRGWYRKEFTLDSGWNQKTDERIRLQFDGVYHVAKVYLNGVFVGRHQGGFTPFEFEVSDLINFSGKNVLAVEADNNYLVGATWNWGGIIRDVRLIKNKDLRIAYQYIHAEPDFKTGAAAYRIAFRVENNSDKERRFELEASIHKGGIIQQKQAEVWLAPNSQKEIEWQGKLAPEKVKLWHFDKPELYQLQSHIKEQGKILHEKSDRFGIRKFEATRSQMLLNGEPVRLVGFNRVSDHRYWGSSEPQEIIDLDVDLMKEAGANFMRIMHGTQNKKLIERCDEKGILIFEEVNVRELQNEEFSPPDYPLVKHWLRKMIERDINHPSIVGWSVGNELTDHFHYVKSTFEFVKKLDPYRMALHVSNQGHKMGESAKNNPLAYGDMIFQNIYQKNPGSVMDTIHARWPDKAIFLSEFGAERFTSPDLDNDIPNLGTWYGLLRGKRPYMTGASIWTYNDYKSPYNYTLPSENRAWGMVNAWRTKRRSFYRHKKENSPLKELSIEGLDLDKREAKISLTCREPNDLPSFTLRNYSLSYSLLDKNGNTLTKGTKTLPLLVPGSGPHSQMIQWQTLAKKPYLLVIGLLTPNGYVRHEIREYFEPPKQASINEVLTSRNKLRVYFERYFGAFEYQLDYMIDGQRHRSHKTIGNYIELDSLPPNQKVTLSLIASNSKGESQASKVFHVETKGKKLPPIIWDAFISDNKLVLGYSGEWEDQHYTVRFGSSKEKLSRMETSNSRGIMTLDLRGESMIYLQIKRKSKNGESQWSPIVIARKGKFRIYE